MADLAITYKEDESIIDKCSHFFKMISGSISFSSSYPDGGESLDLSAKVPTNLHIVIIPCVAGYVFEYDYTNKKVIVYEAGADGAALDQVTATTNLYTAGLTDVRFLAIGK